MSALQSVLSEHVAQVITSLAAAGLVALIGYVYRAGSWTKTHRRARLFEEQGDRFAAGEHWESALEQYKLAIQIWEQELNQARMLALYHKVGKAYSRSGESERALQAFIHCEVLWEAIKKDAKIHEIYHELSEVYLKRKDLERAASYAQKAIRALRTQQSPRLPVALAMAARIAKERGREEEAETEYLEAIRVLDGNGDTLGLASVYYELGNLKAQRQQNAMAVAYYTKSADNYDKLGSSRAGEIRQKIGGASVATT
jgi:tetratricopeptide (TPR) repeat protein